MARMGTRKNQTSQHFKHLHFNASPEWRPRQVRKWSVTSTRRCIVASGNNERITQQADEIKSTIKTFNQAFGGAAYQFERHSNMGDHDFCRLFSAFDCSAG
ncbi:hypothetical protein O9992_00320 [Vibrio lentus]|nr:hypothetical protein [Vibrio lentus]